MPYPPTKVVRGKNTPLLPAPSNPSGAVLSGAERLQQSQVMSGGGDGRAGEGWWCLGGEDWEGQPLLPPPHAPRGSLWLHHYAGMCALVGSSIVPPSSPALLVTPKAPSVFLPLPPTGP